MVINSYQNNPRRINFGWINEAFNIFQRDIGTWIIAEVITVGVGMAIGFAIQGIFALQHIETSRPYDPVHPSLWNIFTIYYWIELGLSSFLGIFVNAYLYAGLAVMANKAVRGQVIGVGDLFSGTALMPAFIVYNLVFAIAIDIGTVVGLIFGGFVVFAFSLPMFALLADGNGFRTAVSKSVTAIKQDWLRATGFAIVLTLLLVAGYLACCVGLLAVVPLVYLTSSLIYRDMIGMPTSGDVIEYAAPQSNEGSWPPAPNKSSETYFNSPPDDKSGE